MRSFSVAALTVLHAVARGTAHGFDIIESTGLAGGTVYPALSRLERDGLITSSWEPVESARAEGRPPRRNYVVTRFGLQSLNSALERLHAMKPVRRAEIAPVKGRS
jgi:PadR family transcriptional regulator, regulatory protein PadR